MLNVDIKAFWYKKDFSNNNKNLYINLNTRKL